MSTFSSLDDILYYRNSHNLINSGLRMCLPRIIDSIPSKETIKKVKVPILIMHSKDDEVIPFECSQILYHNIQHPNKKFIEIRGGHTTPELKKENVDSLLDFCQIKKTTIYPLFVDTWLVELKNFVIHIKE
jgi:pimeloyl-ACP methyl ester carboxylesterase